MASDFEKLPEWLKELWRLAPNIARQAETHIKELETQVAAQQKFAPDEATATVKCISCDNDIPRPICQSCL